MERIEIPRPHSVARILVAMSSICILCIIEISAVSVTRIKVPPHVRDGEMVDLSCDFDLGTQSLYSLNWWKGNQQFYHFSPTGPERKVVYDTQGVDVVLQKSDMKNVVLQNVSLLSSGHYKCEIVTENPSFERDSLSATMEVVEVPRSSPVISLRQIQYNIGDVLIANCTSSGTRPSSQLIWYINGQKVQSHHLKLILPSSPNLFLDDILEESPGVIHIGDVDSLHSIQINGIPLPPIKSSVEVALRPFHFIKGGRATLSCSATLRGLYDRSTEVQLTLPGVSPVEPSQRISQGSVLQPSIFQILLILISTFSNRLTFFLKLSSTSARKHNSSTL